MAEITTQELGGITTLEQRRIVERCTIQLQIEFELFIRNFVLDCSTGNFSDSSGIVTSSLAVKFPNREAAHHFLAKARKSQREPHWALPSEAIKAATQLGLNNLAHISAELGITPWEVDNLRYVRNFIAHRSKESAIKLRTSGLAAANRAIDPVLIALAPSPRGGKNYERWAGFIKGVTRRLAN